MCVESDRVVYDMIGSCEALSLGRQSSVSLYQFILKSRYFDAEFEILVGLTSVDAVDARADEERCHGNGPL